MVTWQCEQLHAHFYDLLPDAHQVVGETQQSAPSGRRCRPDIIVLNAYGEPLAFIEVVRTHLSEQAVAVAKELDIPLFVIPAPDENVVRPTLGAARPWWESVPGFPDLDFARAFEAFTERRDSAGPIQISTAWSTRRSEPPSSPTPARGAALERLRR